MTTIDLGARIPDGQRSSASPWDRRRRRARRHQEALIQAEIRRMAHLLRPYRVLTSDALQRHAGTAR